MNAGEAAKLPKNRFEQKMGKIRGQGTNVPKNRVEQKSDTVPRHVDLQED